MGVIRGGILAVVSVLLLVAFFGSMLFLTMSWSLNYDNVKIELGNTIKEGLRDQLELDKYIDDRYDEMLIYCQEYYDYVVDYKGRKVTVPCSIIEQNKSLVLDNTVDSYVAEIYLQHYDCSFWDCFSQEPIPFFLVSAKAQNYWYSLFNYSLLVIGVLLVLGFLSADKKSNYFILVSALVVLASLPFAKIDWIIGLTGKTAQGLLSVFFSKGYDVFIRGVIFGVILLVIGFILKLFRVGFKISTIFVKSDVEKVEDKVKKLEDKVEGKPVKKEDKKPTKKVNDNKKKKVVKRKLVKKKRK